VPQTFPTAAGDIIYVVFNDTTSSLYYNITVDIDGDGSVTVTGTGVDETVSITSTIAILKTAGPLTFNASTTAGNVFESILHNTGS
jgi:hypothetical protein